MAQEDVFKKLVSHCKEYGFVFPSSEIYDGLAAVYDYGQMGVELKNNIKKYWWVDGLCRHRRKPQRTSEQRNPSGFRPARSVPGTNRQSKKPKLKL